VPQRDVSHAEGGEEVDAHVAQLRANSEADAHFARAPRDEIGGKRRKMRTRSPVMQGDN